MGTPVAVLEVTTRSGSRYGALGEVGLMRRRSVSRRTWAGLVAASVLAGAACSDDDGTASTTEPPAQTSSATTQPATTPPTTAAAATTTTTTFTLPPVEDADAALQAEIDATIAASGELCDPLDTKRCLLPFPSNRFTTADPASDTGTRVNFDIGSMPANASGVSIEPSEWNRNDGFSPLTSMLTHVPGLDPEASKLPSWTDPSASLADGSPVVLVDLDTGERVPVWAEPDARAATDDDRLLVVNPLEVLPEGHRFAVGISHLVGVSGEPLEPNAVFAAYRDRLRLPDEMEARRDSMEEVFAGLASAGVERDDLYLAWDFTVMSERNVSERMLHIRDQTLDLLGDTSPEFTVDAVIDAPDEEGLIARQVVGRYVVPNFLTGDGSPGNRFFYEDGTGTGDDLPSQNGTLEAPFICNVPTVALAPSETGTRISYYGHGLLGTHEQVSAENIRRMANEHNVIFCATKWAGMSEDDVPNAVATLGEISNFPTMADRLQQGVLNQIVLGRLMLAPNGIFQHPAFSDVVELERDRLVFDGNSQGGIMGLMLAAVSPDIERAVLGVPGMSYSMLLPRSIDFDEYEAVMIPAYPSALDRMLALSLIQMLWNRGEGVGYVQHVTSDPFEATPAKEVLLHVALGDHQVSQLTAFIEARALGVDVHEPLATPGRLRTEDYAFGLEPIAYPSNGSGIVLWDSGSPEIPLEGTPPREGRDPHSDPRSDPDARRQKAAFLFDETLIDVCSGPCPADQAP